MIKDIAVNKALAAAGNYDAEDVLSESATVGTTWIFLRCGGSGYITKALAICEITALTPRLTLFLFNKLPTSALNDAVANTALLHADLDNYIGKIDFSALEDLGGDSASEASPSTSGNLPLAFRTTDSTDTLWGILVTRDAITGEAAGMDLTIKLSLEP